MCCANDQYDQFVVPDLVQNTVISDANPAQPFQITLQGRTRIRVPRKPINSAYYPRPILASDTFQFFGRTPLNPNREDHGEPYPNPEPGRLGPGVDR